MGGEVIVMEGVQNSLNLCDVTYERLLLSIYFLDHILGYRMQKKKKKMHFLKMHYADNLIVTENGIKSVTRFECFMKLDVFATLYILWL